MTTRAAVKRPHSRNHDYVGCVINITLIEMSLEFEANARVYKGYCMCLLKYNGHIYALSLAEALCEFVPSSCSSRKVHGI